MRHGRMFALDMILGLLLHVCLCKAEINALRGRALEELLDELGDAEVQKAITGQGNSNPLAHLFNGWANDPDTVAHAIDSLMTSEKSKAGDTSEAKVTAGIPSHPSYNFEGLCPLQDRTARYEAASAAGGNLMKLVAVQNEFRVWTWRAGENRPINPASDSTIVRGGPLGGLPLTPRWETLLEILGVFALLPSLALTDGGNRTTWFNNAAHMSCWEPSPLFAGPMIFKYSDVYPRLTSPEQKRGFFTATAAQSTSFFRKSSPLFLDGVQHQTVRQLLEVAGFSRRYEVDAALVQTVPAVSGSTVDAATVTAAVIPTLMKAVWGVEPPEDIVVAMTDYGKYGKFAIFGEVIEKYALGPVGIAATIKKARETVGQWAKTTPFFQILLAARDIHFAEHPWLMDIGALVADLSDASLFAGMVGTTDLVQKCVNYQLRDDHHKQLFEEDPEKYLVELMRSDSAVTSVTEVLDKDLTMVIAGRRLTFAAGTPVQLVLASANRDPIDFGEPNKFDPQRSDLEKTLAWNGAVKDVEARDFKKAPRHCPGQCLSLKVGAAMCAQLVGSYSKLAAAKKVGGGKVACSNFNPPRQEALWEPPSDWTPRPFHDYANPVYPDFMKKLKSGYECKSADWYVGKFDDAIACARAVKACGGKFFIFGTGLVRGGWCYKEYTRSSDCPEGWEKPNMVSSATAGTYDFYELPDIDSKDVLQCKVDAMPVANSKDSGVLTVQEYRDSIVPLVQGEGIYKNAFQRRYFCKWEHELSCSAGAAEIKEKEACCSLGWWSSSCSITDGMSVIDTVEMDSRGDEWKESKESGRTTYTVFKADPPSYPRLPRDDAYLSVSVGGITKTVREEFNSCPGWINGVLKAFASGNKASYDLYNTYIPSNARSHPIAWLFGKSLESSLLDPAVFDTYTLGMAVAVIHLQLRRGDTTAGEASDLISVPSKQDFLDRLFVNDLRGSAWPEIDGDNSGFLNSAFQFGETCIMDSFREMPIMDGLDQSSENTWDKLLRSDQDDVSHCPGGKKQCSKKEFVLGVFDDYQTTDGNPAYPPQQIDFRGSYYNQMDLWEDAAETFLAFEHLAMHRTKAIPAGNAPTLHGQSAAFVVSTSALGGLKVRAGFAHLGADMFFSTAREPIMIRTPNGDEIWRSEAPAPTWQYWKFIWRSSVFLQVTLVDHLWMTHYSAANSLAGASREGLPPAHSLRRLLTMFTHGTIEVNYKATHQLIGPDALLQRSTPFHDFHEVAQAAHSLMMSTKDAYGAFADDEIFNSMPSSLQGLPIYQDGRLFFQGIDTLVTKWATLYHDEWCNAGDHIKDRNIKEFMKRMDTWTLFDGMSASDNDWLGLYSSTGELTCHGFQKWLKIMLFAVSGYHRHVGTVADVASDPDFASFSNAVGEAFGRPRQHLQMALIAGSTALVFPKVVSDYSFLAAGLNSGATEAAQILKDFQADMQDMVTEVNRRNDQRVSISGHAYLQMHPEHIETSVAV